MAKTTGKAAGRLGTMLTLIGMAKAQWDRLEQRDRDRIVRAFQEHGPKVARAVADRAQRAGRTVAEGGRRAGQALQQRRDDLTKRRH